VTKELQLVKYYEFIRYAMTPDEQSLPDLRRVDWHKFYQFACEQAIVGIVFEGVRRLGEKGLKPPFNLLIELIGLAEQIAVQNKILNKKCVEIVREYQNAGFQCCVLKGQGNATMYPNPHRRMPGDIDLLVMPANGGCKTDDVRRNVIQYVKEKHPDNMKVRYYHVSYQDKRIEVEAHFMPNIMNNPFYYHRLQKWYNKRQSEHCQNRVELPDGVGTIPIPTVEFNIIFQLAHMMHHFFDEGIGLRQFVDYYYLLNNKKKLEEVKGQYLDLQSTLRYLGLLKFARAVMYVMKEVFAMDEKYMITTVDEQRGKTLMVEILKGGNFGQHSGLTNRSMGSKYFAKTLRNMQLVREYPVEALCEPIFRTWHFFWRLSY